MKNLPNFTKAINALLLLSNSDSAQDARRAALIDLESVIVEKDFGSVAAASRLLSGDSGFAADILPVVLARITYEVLSKGAPAEVTKADVLGVLKGMPIIPDFIPTSPRGITQFWKKVGVEIAQARGYTTPEMKRWLGDFFS